MSQLGRVIIRPDLRWSRVVRVAVLRRLLRILWRHVFSCAPCRSAITIATADRSLAFQYFRLDEDFSSSGEEQGMSVSVTAPAAAAMDPPRPLSLPLRTDSYDSDDVVSLKISLLGDCQIGKTSFMIKYVGDDEEKMGLQMNGLNLLDKVFVIRGARIAFSIWDVGGDLRFMDRIPLACKDAAAILIMFDLTNRCSLNNTTNWYRRARRWNTTGIPILIGTKFDDFVQLPLLMQWTIVNEMAYNTKSDRVSVPGRSDVERASVRVSCYVEFANNHSYLMALMVEYEVLNVIISDAFSSVFVREFHSNLRNLSTTTPKGSVTSTIQGQEVTITHDYLTR